MVFYSLYFFISIMISEIALAISAYGNLSNFTIYTILFTVCSALLFGAICSLFGKKAGRVIAFVITIVLLILYLVQLIYQHTFTNFMSLTQVGMGGDAITTFWREILITMSEVVIYIIVLLLPLITLIILTKKKVQAKFIRLPWYSFVIILAVFALLHFATVTLIKNSGNEAYGPNDVYNDTFVLSRSEQHFGVLQSARLEIRGMLFGVKESEINVDPVEPDPGTDPETPVDPEKPVEYNKDDSLDFAEMAENEKNDKIKTLHQYFAAQTASKKNDYTGMFKDYNLIVLCCESWSPYLIDKERTPILYKMATEGFVFSDYWDTICDNTSNSEYTLLTGLLPDPSLLTKLGWKKFNQGYNSCVYSAENSMPLTWANLLKEEGVTSYGFHFYNGGYYGRNKSHPNFGYKFYAAGSGLKKSTFSMWPSSDLEMMEKSVDYYLKPNADGVVERFHTYYMTFSGHLPYNSFSANDIAGKNKAVSQDLDLPTNCKVYIACNQELENALAYLFEKLEAAGVMDNTLIVLTPDHYPYNSTLGLGGEKNGKLTGLSAIAGKNLTATKFDAEFNQYKGALLIWAPTMTEPVYVDETVCELDILPTVCNLMGIEFDSRLLMGRDALSDSEHMAVLLDRSFITDKIFYNANTAEVTLREGVDPSEITDEYVQRYVNIVKNKFTVSNEILYNDYYSHVFKKGTE